MDPTISRYPRLLLVAGFKHGSNYLSLPSSFTGGWFQTWIQLSVSTLVFYWWLVSNMDPTISLYPRLLLVAGFKHGSNYLSLPSSFTGGWFQTWIQLSLATLVFYWWLVSNMDPTISRYPRLLLVAGFKHGSNYLSLPSSFTGGWFQTWIQLSLATLVFYWWLVSNMDPTISLYPRLLLVAGFKHGSNYLSLPSSFTGGWFQTWIQLSLAVLEFYW